MGELTREAMAAYDAHDDTYYTVCVFLSGAKATAWFDARDRLRDALGEAFAADTAGINDADTARRVPHSHGGLAWLRRISKHAAPIASAVICQRILGL